MKIKVLFTAILFYASVNISFSQTGNDFTLFDEINKTALDLKQVVEEGKSTKAIVKKLDEISKKSNKDVEEIAIVNAKIGSILTEQKLYNEATYFYKKAFKYRKKQGDFYPQRWELNSLIENGFKKNNFKQIYKYGKKWLFLTEQHADELGHLYRYRRGPHFEVELERFLLRVHPCYVSSWREEKIDNWSQRRVYSLKLLNFYLKNFPNQKQEILKDSKEFFEYGIQRIFENEEGHLAEKWARNSLRILKKHTSRIEYADFVRFFASQFKKKESLWITYPTNTNFESVGMKLMDEYIRASKKLKDYNQVIFGYRYLAKRYQVLDDYQKTVQYLATAIKYCRKYGLEKEIYKSLGGINQILLEIGKDEDKVSSIKKMNWKDNYSLKGLLKEDIEQIDRILLSIDLFK